MAKGATAVFERRGYSVRAVPVPEAILRCPDELCKVIMEDMMSLNGTEAVFVLNGGQKYAVLGIGLAHKKRPFRLAYLDTDPATTLLEMEPGDSAFQGVPISTKLSAGDALHLEEWMDVNRFEFLEGKHPVKIWPETGDLIAVPPVVEKFSSDLACRAVVFGLHQKLKFHGDTEGEPKGGKLAFGIPDEMLNEPAFQQDWATIIEAEWTKGRESNARVTSTPFERLQKFFRLKLAAASSVKLPNETAAERIFRRNLKDGALGNVMEEAVKHRLLRFLRKNNAPKLAEVWADVHVEP